MAKCKTISERFFYVVVSVGLILVLCSFTTSRTATKDDTLSAKAQDKPGQMYYFLDGVEITEQEARSIDGDEIHRMDKKADRETFLLFGKNENAAGLMFFTSKKAKDSDPYAKKVIYFLNGYEITAEEYSALRPSDIVDIDVVIDKRTLEQYRTPDADGIFFITGIIKGTRTDR